MAGGWEEDKGEGARAGNGATANQEIFILDLWVNGTNFCCLFDARHSERAGDSPPLRLHQPVSLELCRATSSGPADPPSCPYPTSRTPGFTPTLALDARSATRLNERGPVRLLHQRCVLAGARSKLQPSASAKRKRRQRGLAVLVRLGAGTLTRTRERDPQKMLEHETLEQQKVTND